MSQLGRISGQLLKDNLTRNGHDLTFDNDLLHLDVTGRKIGIKNTSPSTELDVTGTTKTTDLIVTTQSDLDDLTVLGDTITSNTGTLNLTNTTSDQVTVTAKLVVDDIDLSTNIISTNIASGTNTNLEFRPHGTGSVDIYANTNIYGDVYVSGNIRADGNITVGDSNTDNITISADVNSNIIPDADITYTLGNGGTGYVAGTEFTLGDVTLTVSGTGTTVVLSIPAAGPTWIDTLTAHTVGKAYQIALDGTPGSYALNTLGSWTGTNPQTVSTTNDGLVDGVYNVASIRFDQKRWLDLWVKNVYTDALVSGDITVDGVNLNSVQGKIYYVATTGSDTNAGQHQNDPFATVKYALSVATADDTVYIYPGTYTEQFPLTVPVGVVVKGAGIRSVKIVPTTATRYNDAFLLNGETTVEDVTIADFFSGGNYFAVTTAGIGEASLNVGTAPFAHTWVSGGTINISGTDYSIIAAVYSHTTGILTVNHTGPDATSASPVFLSGLIFSCNGGNRTFPDNGYAFRFATDFVVTSRSPYVRNITVLTRGSVTSLSDPLGYNQGDAGKGAYIDGAYATALSKEASMLFHSATFICPGVDVIVATNGARVEWLNSFTYYANRSMYLYSSNDGFAGAGLTRLKLPAATRTGTWAVGNTVSYYDTNGTTVLTSGTVASVDGDWVNLTGRVQGFLIPDDRAPKTVTLNGDAKLSTAQKKFGTAGLVLDGTGDFITLSSQVDFGYGTGDFTIEFFWRPTAIGVAQVLLDCRTATNDTALYLEMNAAGSIRLFVSNAYRITSSVACTAGTFNHIVLFRTGGTTKLAVNGTITPTTFADATNYPARPFRLGASWTGGALCTGYFDELRVVKGVTKYTTAVTVPTIPFLADTSTVLLLHFNGLNNSTNVVDDGVTFVDIRSSAGGTTTDLAVADYSDFGVELRSIGSAAVYGNYGIYGDGAGVIAYLIGQNLAYIGNGKETTNDPNTVIQANEVVELNDAKIFYNSVDHKGDFRIGDLFYVNQATGEVSFTNSNVTIGTSLTFDDGGGNITYLDATKIETGDFRISGNTVETLSQDFNVDSATNQINLQSNVTVTGNLDVTGDVTVGGNVTIGNESTDVVRFVAGVDSDILPKLDSTYDLGTSTERWSTLYSTTLINAKVQISTNVITTTDSNLDLTLQANGTGRIYIPSNNVEITNNLTVNGTTDVQDLNVTGTLTHIGDVTQTGNITQTGDITLTGTFTTTGYGQFADIKIDNNNISTTIGTHDLILDAAGTGRIYVPDSDVEITQDLTVTGFIDVGSLNIDTSISSLTLTAGDVKIQDNYITTLTGNNNLELRANGSGLIYIPSNNVQIDNNLTVLGTTDLKTTNIGVVGSPSTVTHVGTVTQTGDLTQTGSTEITGTLTVGSTAQFQDIKIDTNIITTTVGNNNLVLSAAGTGRIYVPTNDVTIENTLTVVGTTTTSTISNTGTVTSGTFNTSNVSITSNNITSRTGNSNLVLEAAGTGKIYVPSNSVQLDQNLTVNGSTYLKDTTIVGTVTQTGAVTQTGDLFQTGNTEITGTLTVGSTIQFEDINIDNNVITTTIGNNDLVLEAAGTGKILIPTNDAEVTGTLNVVGVTYTSTIENTGTVTSGTFNTNDISISTNNIATTLLNSNLVLEADGNGIISIPTSDVELGQNLTVLGTTTLSVPLGTALTITGDITHTGAVTQTGDVDQTGNLTVTGTLDVGSTAQFEDINIDNNVITTTIGNNDLVLEASGTGKVIVPLDDAEVTGTLTVLGTTSTTTINNTGTITSGIFSTGTIRITTNNITTTVGNTDLVLEASGTGRIYVPTNDVTLGKTLTVTGLTTLVDTGITGTLTHVGATTRTGDVTQTGSYTLNGNLTVSNIAQFKDVNITNNVITTTLTNSNLQLGAAGTGIISVPTNNVTIDNNLTVTGTTYTANINNSGTVTAGTFSTGNISINGNTIQTTVSSSNLQLQAAGTGYIQLEQFDVQGNEIRINTGSDMVLTPNGTGIVTVDSTQSIKLPVGNIAARPTGAAGMVRFNSELSRYEGYNGTAWVRLDGVEDADGNTKITAEATPGANDNTIRFYTNGTQVADLTSTRLNVINVDVDAININNNVISTTTTDTNLVLAPNGTGSVRTGNFSISGSTITNTVNNSITYFNQTAGGYVKINSTGGFVIPTGLTTERPPLFDVGMMRYNTDPGNFRVEVWDGANWVNAGQAAGGGVTLAEAQDIGIVSAIIFG